jgi:hypothetical protein
MLGSSRVVTAMLGLLGLGCTAVVGQPTATRTSRARTTALAYQECVAKEVGRLYWSEKPANIVVDAALAACPKEETAMRAVRDQRSIATLQRELRTRLVSVLERMRSERRGAPRRP